MLRRFVPLLLIVPLAFAACTPTAPGAPAPPASPRPAALAAVTGQVTSAAARPIAGAEVRLADAAGRALAGFAATTTDAEGRYALSGVPAGYTVLVTASGTDEAGRAVRLEALTRSTTLGATADLDAATTIVTAAIVGDDAPGVLNPGTFAEAALEARRAMPSDGPPADLSDRARARAFAAQLADKSSRLRSALDKLTAELGKDGAAADALAAAGAGLPPCAQTFEATDLDRSGGVDFLEHQAAMRKEGLNLGEPGFKQRDIDRDGLIEEEETCLGRAASGTQP